MLSIKALPNNKYEVKINSKTATSHFVTLSDKDYKDLTNKKTLQVANFGRRILSLKVILRVEINLPTHHTIT